jgi:phospholipase/carboxylesterase
MKLRHILAVTLAVAALALLFGLPHPQAQAPNDAGAPEPNGEAAFTPREHGLSWKDQATEAFMRSDWHDSIYWYRKALEANPKDNHGWYNLACVYMYLEQQEKAIDALIAAFETGWDDLAHTRNDSDVTAILDHPKVAAAIQWVEEKAASATAPDTERRFFRYTSTGTYVAYLPPDYAESDQSYPAVLILHGRGSTETNHGNALSALLGREGVIYLAVRFPHPNIPFIGRNGIAGFEVGPPESAAEQGPEFDALTIFADAVDQSLKDALATYRIDPSRVHVMGHSQGGASAIAYALRHPNRIKSCFSHAGFAPNLLLTEENAQAASASGIQFLLTHSTGDGVVPLSASQGVAEVLKAAGASVELFTPDSTSHGFPPEVRERGRQWADQVVRGLKAE